MNSVLQLGVQFSASAEGKSERDGEKEKISKCIWLRVLCKIYYWTKYTTIGRLTFFKLHNSKVYSIRLRYTVYCWNRELFLAMQLFHWGFYGGSAFLRIGASDNLGKIFRRIKYS